MTALVAPALLLGGLSLWLALPGLAKPICGILAAALAFGTMAYLVQRPARAAAAPVPARAALVAEDPALLDLRDRMLGRFTLDAAYLTAADAMARNGDRRTAVRALLGGINRIPRSLPLWTALGSAFAAHDGRVSPPARLAFAQAARIAPTHPAPPFFLALAYAEAGDTAGARPLMARALALSPPGASYRRDIAERLARLDRDPAPPR